MADRITMKIPGKPEYVGTVRMAVSHAASRKGFDIDAIEDIKVAVSEACTNIVCHAHENPDFVYEVYIDIGGDFSVTIQDDGVGFGMDEYTPPVPGESRGSGMGIHIIKALMDEVEIQSEPGVGTRIRMIKRL